MEGVMACNRGRAAGIGESREGSKGEKSIRVFPPLIFIA